MEVIHNKNHSIREQISYLSYIDISTSHPHSIDDVISPKMLRKVDYIIGVAIVEISSKQQVNMLYSPT